MIDRLAKVEQRLDSVLPTLSTKADVEGVRADVHKGQSEMKTWMMATVFALLLGLFTIGTFMSNNLRTILADARSTSSNQPAAPVIIHVPVPHTSSAGQPPAGINAEQAPQAEARRTR